MYTPRPTERTEIVAPHKILLLAYVVANTGAENVPSAHNYTSGNVVLCL